VGEDALLVHDAHRRDPGLAFELAHLAERPTGPTPVGVFRDIQRPVYGEEFAKELAENRAEVGMEDLRELLHSGGAWTVG
jgi:2-oxoglutarate ferredoxin oxidoreductase subunit beta